MAYSTARPIGTRSALHLRAQRLPFEQLRDDEGRLVMPANVVNREDIGMRESSDRQRFLFESL